MQLDIQPNFASRLLFRSINEDKPHTLTHSHTQPCIHLRTHCAQQIVSFSHGTQQSSGWVPWAKYIIDEGEDVALAAAEAGNLDLMHNPTLKGVTKVNATSILFLGLWL